MKTAEEIAATIAEIIADIHHRPSLYIGTTSEPRSAYFLEIYMGMLHNLWGLAQSRDGESAPDIREVQRKHCDGPRGFAHTFYERNPDKDERAACDHVLKCWAEIDSVLQIDISEAATGR
jgi:hypothetical protein